MYCFKWSKNYDTKDLQQNFCMYSYSGIRPIECTLCRTKFSVERNNTVDLQIQSPMYIGDSTLSGIDRHFG